MLSLSARNIEVISISFFECDWRSSVIPMRGHSTAGSRCRKTLKVEVGSVSSFSLGFKVALCIRFWRSKMTTEKVFIRHPGLAQLLLATSSQYLCRASISSYFICRLSRRVMMSGACRCRFGRPGESLDYFVFWALVIVNIVLFSAYVTNSRWQLKSANCKGILRAQWCWLVLNLNDSMVALDVKW